MYEICALEMRGPSAQPAPSHILEALRGCPTDSLGLLPTESDPKLQSGLLLWEVTRLIRGRHQSHHPAAAATASHHSHQGVFINMDSSSFAKKKNDNFP